MARPPSPTIGAPELRAMCRIAQKAADEVMELYAGEIQAWSKQDDSPLTQADLRADAAIREGLQAAFPGIFILSEESVCNSTGGCDGFFLVDPLDGTREFISRNGEFTVNIAWVAQGEPMAGVVLAPALVRAGQPIDIRCRAADGESGIYRARPHRGARAADRLSPACGTI